MGGRTVVGFPQLTDSGEVVDGEHPADWTRHPPTVWRLDDETVRQLHGAAVLEVVKAARPPAGRSPVK